MEKLLELANQYEREKEKSEGIDVDKYVLFKWEISNLYGLSRYDKTDQWEGDNLYGDTSIAYLISKSFGFIERLVENDKIDKEKIDTRLVRNVESHYDEDGYWVENSYEDYSITDTLLMLLAISDTPIDDLVSYLR